MEIDGRRKPEALIESLSPIRHLSSPYVRVPSSWVIAERFSDGQSVLEGTPVGDVFQGALSPATTELEVNGKVSLRT